MKKSHIRTQQLIQQAIQSCGSEFALEDTKLYLIRALNSISKVGKKRANRETAASRFAEEAKRQNEKWWNMIVEGAKKAAEQLENPNQPPPGES